MLRARHCWRSREARLRYTEVLRIELALPAEVVRQAMAATGLSAGMANVEGMRPDLALLEDGRFGPLPRMAPDGRRPFLAYALSV